MSLARILAVIRFELARTATLPRVAWWLVLALYPLAIVLLILSAGGLGDDNEDAWPWIIFALVPITGCILGLLLWATPALQSELEGSTWGYLAVRPFGKLSVLLGKYVIAVLWTALAGWAAISLAIMVAQPDGAFHLWGVLAVLILLASLAYGALFLFIGVLIHKRAMVVAVGYTLVFELVVGTMPATINQLTVFYRLRNLLLVWVDWKYPQHPPVVLLLPEAGPPLNHVFILLTMTAAFLAAVAYLVRKKELVPTGDV